MLEFKPAFTNRNKLEKITPRQLRGRTEFRKQWTEPHLREQPEREKQNYDLITL